MEAFKKQSDEFRLNEPNIYTRNLRGATIGNCEEQYLFLLCAYDYVYNPDSIDLKLRGIRNLFFTEDNAPVHIDVDAPNWFLNIGGSGFARSMHSSATRQSWSPLKKN